MIPSPNCGECLGSGWYIGAGTLPPSPCRTCYPHGWIEVNGQRVPLGPPVSGGMVVVQGPANEDDPNWILGSALWQRADAIENNGKAFIAYLHPKLKWVSGCDIFQFDGTDICSPKPGPGRTKIGQFMRWSP